MLRKEAEAKRKELEDKQKLLRGEQNDYRGQLENLLEHFNEQVAIVKLLPKCACRHSNSKSILWDSGGGTMGIPIKLINPPSLHLFSGANPTPKDEANYEQWLFQARGALTSHTEEVVQSGII